jgi:hypothetical protein
MFDTISMRAFLALAVALGSTAGLARADEPVVEGQKHPFLGCLARPFKKTSCAIHEDTLSCNSWHTECRFVFGSCKEFFGDPCPDRAFDGKRHKAEGKGDCGCR